MTLATGAEEASSGRLAALVTRDEKTSLGYQHGKPGWAGVDSRGRGSRSRESNGAMDRQQARCPIEHQPLASRKDSTSSATMAAPRPFRCRPSVVSTKPFSLAIASKLRLRT